MKVSSWLRCAACVLFVCSLMALPGCEKGPDTDELTSYNFPGQDEWSSFFTRTSLSNTKLIIISPGSSASLSSDGETLAIQASGGTAPFSWSVNDISVGTIAEHSGRNAVYKRNAAGDNVVVVKDKNGNEAYCTISQP